MREIKFRAWDRLNEEMIDVVAVDFRSGYSVITDLDGRNHDLYNCNLLQYTGIKDKNEKKIYDGDILRWVYVDEEGQDNYEVVFNQEKCAFQAQWLKNRVIVHAPDSEFEIIGNIYENPDLLKI